MTLNYFAFLSNLTYIMTAAYNATLGHFMIARKATRVTSLSLNLHYGSHTFTLLFIKALVRRGAVAVSTVSINKQVGIYN